MDSINIHTASHWLCSWGEVFQLCHVQVEFVCTQVQAYTDNRLDVGQLLEDSEQRVAAVDRAAELDEELSRTVERLQEVENENINKVAELQRQLQEKMKEIETFKVMTFAGNTR